MLHVAVLLKPYLDLIIAGTKTIECRLTMQARDPYDRIEPGERIYFKQSAGPFGATAIAEHVMCENALIPKRVNQIRRDYNSRICGDDAFWTSKRNSKFCTLIWLKDIAPIDNGPAIRALQGVAWLVLEEDLAWRRTDSMNLDKHASHVSRNPQPTDKQSFAVEITEGNLRNNSLYVTRVAERFPDWAFGGADKRDAAPPITLVLHEGPTVSTDIVRPRNMIRSRVWGAWFRTHGVQPGDRVVFTPLDASTYFVGLSRAAKQS